MMHYVVSKDKFLVMEPFLKLVNVNSMLSLV